MGAVPGSRGCGGFRGFNFRKENQFSSGPGRRLWVENGGQFYDGERLECRSGSQERRIKTRATG